jgi:hypothetical protein
MFTLFDAYSWPGCSDDAIGHFAWFLVPLTYGTGAFIVFTPFVKSWTYRNSPAGSAGLSAVPQTYVMTRESDPRRRFRVDAPWRCTRGFFPLEVARSSWRVAYYLHGTFYEYDRQTKETQPSPLDTSQTNRNKTRLHK